IIEKSLGQSFIIDYPKKFSTRVIVQKVLYLLTHGNLNPKLKIPYKWSFYLHGPYSPEIANMIYHINDLSNELDRMQIHLGDNEIKAINHFLDFNKSLTKQKNEIKGFNALSEEELFEILATLTYMAKQVGGYQKKISDSFKRFKPELDKKMSKPVLNSIFSNLTKYGYI
ncbi:MAG: hypothetical protein ACFFD2_26230, partial [Promethearchaeota archaeon]